MLETMYAATEQNGAEAQSVVDFANRFIRNDEMEGKFYEAVRDSRLIGFREGVKAALTLFAEIQ